MENIELHIRNARTLLKSSSEVKVSQLIPSHIAMRSILHEKADGEEIDTSALIYSLLRLPSCILQVKRIILGQSYTVFKKNGFAQIDSWHQVETPGRRRKMFFDSKETLAVYIGSVSDVDDLITLLTAFQIEANKVHEALAVHGSKVVKKLLSPDDFNRLTVVLGTHYEEFITFLTENAINYTIKMLSGSYVEYMRATQYWWNHIADSVSSLHINERPIYFVSSNLHSLVNVTDRFVLDEKEKLLTFVKSLKEPALPELLKNIQSGTKPGSEEFFLNYIAKKYARSHPEFANRRQFRQKDLGIHTVVAHHYLDISVQIIELSKLAQSEVVKEIKIDPRQLNKSNAIIINIDYPLGWAAYQILTEVAQNVDTLRGVYIMGKAATLNGEIGDITIPSTVFDLHTKNAYVFNNCFTATEMQESIKAGTIFGHQKSLTVKGTFFQNREFLNHWYKEGYTTIEMEAGPYLNALYECVYYNRYAENQFINLLNMPFELGIAHYASDTPNSKAKNLGARNLSYDGVESTYGISLTILKRILKRETDFTS